MIIMGVPFIVCMFHLPKDAAMEYFKWHMGEEWIRIRNTSLGEKGGW